MTQLTSLASSSIVGYSNFGASRVSFLHTPIINVKLPRFPNSSMSAPVRLSSALSQTESFVENKMIVPKHKMVFHSRDLLFFYVNRRYHSVNLASMETAHHLQYMTLPGTISNVTRVNQTDLHFDERFPIGSSNNMFYLRSVVVLNDIPKSEFATIGCSSIVISRNAPPGLHRPNPVYFYYNPVTANLMYVDPNTRQYTTNKPIMTIPDHRTHIGPGFYDLARKFGTIFVYSDKNDN